MLQLQGAACARASSLAGACALRAGLRWGGSRSAAGRTGGTCGGGADIARLPWESDDVTLASGGQKRRERPTPCAILP